MKRYQNTLVAVAGMLVFGLLAWPVYAHCGKCASSVKDMVKKMDDGKLSLGKAIELAEEHSKGKAVAAYCELEDGGLEIEVYCLVGDKIMEVEIDGKTGKVSEMKEAKALPAHKEHAHDETHEDKQEDKEEDKKED